MKTSVFYTLIISLLLVVSTTLFTVFQNMNYSSDLVTDAVSSAAIIDFSPVVKAGTELATQSISRSIIEVPVGNELPVLLMFSFLFIAIKVLRK